MLTTPLTPFHIANLAKLADFLDALPDNYAHFRMANYFGKYYEDDEHPYPDAEPSEVDPARLINCGTCACAVGHGIAAGIEAMRGENWHEYERRAFGVSVRDPNFEAWDFMFGPDNPDDAKAAARRIREVLAGAE